MLTLEDAAAIVKPLMAKYELDEAEARIELLLVKIFDLKAALASCVALMDLDAEIKPPSTTRRDVIERARKLSK